MASPMSHPHLCCYCFEWIMPGQHAKVQVELLNMHQSCYSEDAVKAPGASPVVDPSFMPGPFKLVEDDQMRLSDSNGDSGE